MDTINGDRLSQETITRERAENKAVEKARLDAIRLPQVMEEEIRPEHPRFDSSGSTSSDGYSTSFSHQMSNLNDPGDFSDSPAQYTPNSTLDGGTPLTGYSSSQPSWNSQSQGQTRGGSTTDSQDHPSSPANGMPAPIPKRPNAPARTVSSTYQPDRRPAPKQTIGGRKRSFSNPRKLRDPQSSYRAQEQAYIQQLRQEQYSDYLVEEPYTPSLGYSTDSETEDESPSGELYLENDMYDQDTQLFYNTDSLQPSEEELMIPANRERLEWHGMLATVLKGDVVKQEKQRLIGIGEQKGEQFLRNEIWLGIRARVCGRTDPQQRRVIEEGRAGISTTIESIITFQIQGEAQVGKTAVTQVQDVVKKIEQCESLFPTRQALGEAVERAESEPFIKSSEAVVAWHNTMELINTELSVLRGWVGNEELDFGKASPQASAGGSLTEDSSFLDRLLKDDGLASLQGKNSMLQPVADVIKKAKHTLIVNAEEFAKRHLPPYIEELLTLINFPSRLIQEIIRMRLTYTVSMKEPHKMSVMMQTSIISQFQTLLKLAVRIKQEYTTISQPESGWDLPPCIDENFDLVVLEALKFYFKMLNSRLVGNRNTFKEAEILEQEWDFSNEIGRYLEGGDVEVAEQFSGLTAKALQRLTSHFENELTRKSDENAIDMDKRYKQILDSVRVRQRKLFRFSRLLSQKFENATEYNISLESKTFQHLHDALIDSGHFIISSPLISNEEVFMIASPSLWDRPKSIQAILGTSFQPEEKIEDPTDPYVLLLRPDERFLWDGKKMEITMRAPSIDVRKGRLRLVAESSHRLQNARTTFLQAIGISLDMLTEVRANLPRVNMELGRIKKTTFKLSNTIMESVEIIRKQTRGQENQELIQTCFAFATEFGTRSLFYMDVNRRMMNNLKLTRLALDWVSFICDDCVASDRRSFKWAVVALEFAMVMTQGPNMITITDDEFTRLRQKVAGCMSLLISHFDIMGARSTLAAQAEKQRTEATSRQGKFDVSKMKDDAEASRYVRDQWLAQLNEIEEARKQKVAGRQALGRVMEGSNDADRSLTYLSSSATNVTMRWQQGQYLGGGTFGSVYAAFNIDSGTMMAVKEIRLQDPQLIPTVAGQIRDEQAVLEVLDHPNIVSYYGIEVHRDKVYIFMEYCSGGSLANLLEHGRIEDETVIQVYALQMLEGLAYLHQSSIAHRDIKPESESAYLPFAMTDDSNCFVQTSSSIIMESSSTSILVLRKSSPARTRRSNRNHPHRLPVRAPRYRRSRSL